MIIGCARRSRSTTTPTSPRVSSTQTASGGEVRQPSTMSTRGLRPTPWPVISPGMRVTEAEALIGTPAHWVAEEPDGVVWLKIHPPQGSLAGVHVSWRLRARDGIILDVDAPPLARTSLAEHFLDR